MPKQGFLPPTGTSGSDPSKVAKAGDTMSGLLTLSADPTNALHAATRQYVDAAVVGAVGAIKVLPVACVSTGNLDLTGEETIDGVATSASRVLAASQSTASQGGIYVSGGAGWARATDADTAAEVTKGQAVFVSGGTLYQNTLWVSTATVTTLGTDACTWAQIQGAANSPWTYETQSGTSFTISKNITTASNLGTVVATLPSATAWAGRTVTVYKSGSAGTVAITRAGSDTIMGSTSPYVLAIQNESVTLVSVGTNWVVV